MRTWSRDESTLDSSTSSIPHRFLRFCGHLSSVRTSVRDDVPSEEEETEEKEVEEEKNR